jgi:peptidoglycan/xylan/chitin deacetylase (PgdA/CDA1 family)
MAIDSNQKWRIPILAYHRVAASPGRRVRDGSNSPFTISERQFRQHLTFLRENDFKTVHLDAVLKKIDGHNLNGSIEKLIVLTFDDGWRDNFTNAFRLLQEFGFCATFFVISGRIDSNEYMTWDHLQELQSHKMTIAAHTHSHTALELISDSEAEWEVRHSKEVLEDRLGRAIRFMSFPHGSYNDRILQIVKSTGYSGSCTSNAAYGFARSNRFELPRILVRKKLDMPDFSNLCRANAATIVRHKLIQQTKNAVRNTLGLRQYMALHRLIYKTHQN